MAVCLLKSDKVSDGSKSSDKKSVLDPKFGCYGAAAAEALAKRQTVIGQIKSGDNPESAAKIGGII